MEAITLQNSEWHLLSAFRGRRSPARIKPPRTVSQGSGLMVQTSSPNQLQWEMLHQTRFRLNGTEIANQKWLLPLSGVSSCNRTSLPPWKWREGATAVQVSRWVVVSCTNFPDSELSVSNQGGGPPWSSSGRHLTLLLNPPSLLGRVCGSLTWLPLLLCFHLHRLQLLQSWAAWCKALWFLPWRTCTYLMRRWKGRTLTNGFHYHPFLCGCLITCQGNGFIHLFLDIFFGPFFL